VHLSSNVIHLAAEHNVDVVFLDSSGQPTARVWQTKMGSTAAIRRRQLEAAETEEAMRYVRDWTATKVRHQLEFLRELQHRRPDAQELFTSPLGTLQECLNKITACQGTVDEQRATLMGLEGAAGRAYFVCLRQLVPEEYRFTGRSRQPALDPFNAMLNYAYGVLYSRVERALILAGLDPFVGFLHTDNYNKRSLVFDMIEPFRILGERTTVLLFTGRRAKREYFREIPGGIELGPDGRAALMESFNKRLDRTVRYPVQREHDRGPPKYRKIKQHAVIQHEAHALANALLGRHDIPRIVESRQLFSGDE
jgi:CRISPR-associated protein Cas1